MSDHTENLAYQLYLVAQRNRNHLAIIQDENKVTYGQFIQAVFAFTKKLKQHGVRQGSVLVIDTGDTVTLLAFMFATAFLGAKWARADKFLASSRVIKPSHFFRSPDKKGSKARDFILIDDSWSVEQTKPTVSAEELSNAAIPEGHWIYTHTSGTTGVPKFLGWTQKMVLLRSRASKIDFVERQTRFACLFGNTARPFISRAIAAMLSGSTLVDSQDISLWRRAGVNFVMGSPNQVADHLLGQKLSPRIPILHVGGGKLKDSLVPELLQSFETVVDIYGSAEANQTHKNVKSLEPGGNIITTGVALDSVVEIVDALGHPCKMGEVGTVRVKNPYLASGYLNHREAQEKSFRDGWFHPGDIGSWGKNAELQIVGRDDDVLNIGGVKLIAVLADNVLKSVSGISDAMCFLNPRATKQDELLAFAVFSEPGQHGVVIQTAKQLCQQKLGILFTPRRIFSIAEIPVGDKGDPSRAACQIAVAEHILSRKNASEE